MNRFIIMILCVLEFVCVCLCTLIVAMIYQHNHENCQYYRACVCVLFIYTSTPHTKRTHFLKHHRDLWAYMSTTPFVDMRLCFVRCVVRWHTRRVTLCDETIINKCVTNMRPHTHTMLVDDTRPVICDHNINGCDQREFTLRCSSSILPCIMLM